MFVEHPKAVGDRSTLAIMAALQASGYAIFVPFGENTRCDLGIEIGPRIARVQCKTGRLRKGAVRFKVCSSYAHHRAKTPSRDYLGQVDFFAIYCPETSGVYLVPIEDISLRSQGALRIDPPRNHQRRGIRFAADYAIGVVAIRPSEPAATGGPGGSAGA
jgi:hypothetical protein